MTQLRRFLAIAGAAFAVAVIASGRIQAQVTTGAISGTVRDSSAGPIESAQVQVTNRATGLVRGVTTNSSGFYAIPGLEVGSTYSVSVRRIGYAPQTRDNVVVNLGQSTRIDFALARQVTQIDAVRIVAETNSLISPTRTGASTIVSDSSLRRLPSLNRNFTDFVALTPQVSNSGPGLSGGGTNNRFNNITIDGSISSDLFGLGSTGQPGGQANGKSIGIESVKEYQVLLSPYDVRQGNFSGAAINAVTKSGTNTMTGSAYAVTRNRDLVREQPYIREFDQTQYGIAVGGPVVRDRVFFFVNPEWQQRTTPAAGPYVGDGTSSVTQAVIDQFNNLVGSRGIPQGSGRSVDNENPLTNVFARLDFMLPRNSSLMLRHNYAKAQDDNFGRSTATFNLDNNGYAFTSNHNSTVAQLRTNFVNGNYNEMLVSFNKTEDRRRPNVYAPMVSVATPVGSLVAGGERFSQANELDQQVVEITNNFTMPILDGSHRLTIGTQNQFFKYRNLFAQSRLGVWDFVNIDSLTSGQPRQYIVGVPVSGDGAVRLSARQHALYLQDDWAVSPRVNVTLGVRADAPFFNDSPPTNPDILEPLCAAASQPATANCGFARNTADVPSGNWQFSPRVGFNWDVTGDQRNQLRGGVGLFTGRPAYVWLSNAFQNSGRSGVALLTCNAAAAPKFTAAAATTAPTTCVNGTSAAAGAEINLLSKGLNFPQNLRTTLGFDRDIGWGIVATSEVMYTLGVNNPFYTNLALFGPQGTDRFGRTIYGTAPNAPVVRVTGRNLVLDVQNQSKDYAVQLTGGLQKRFSDGWEGSLMYTWSQARDVQSLTSSTAFSQYRFGRTYEGLQEDLSLGRSFFEQKHRLIGQATYSFQKTLTDLTVLYIGESGAPYGYTSSGDLNGDGFTLNDAIYIPRRATDPNEMLFRDFTRPGTTTVVTAAQQAVAFDKFIDGAECLRSQRGQIMERNSCFNPWTNTVNLSLRQSLKTLGVGRLSLQLDVFNFLNLLNKEWGERPTAGFGSQTLISYVTRAAGSMTGTSSIVPVHTFDPNYQRFLQNNLGSNYQMQLQVKYSY
jgi:hypothetical protein